MKKVLEVGKVYENRFSHKVQIIKREGDRFYDTDGNSYGLYGVTINKGSMWDLVYEAGPKNGS